MRARGFGVAVEEEGGCWKGGGEGSSKWTNGEVGRFRRRLCTFIFVGTRISFFYMSPKSPFFAPYLIFQTF